MTNAAHSVAVFARTITMMIGPRMVEGPSHRWPPPVILQRVVPDTPKTLTPRSAIEAYEAYLQGAYHPDHYEVLRLSQGASAGEVRDAFLKGAWGLRWVPQSDSEKVLAHDLRAAAFSTLNDPVKRAAYDRSIGLTRSDLSASVVKRAGWGPIWSIAFGFLSVFCLLFTDNTSRAIGQHFAPDFQEVRVQESTPSEGNPYISRFESSSARWQEAMNNWLIVGLVPAAALGLVAFLGFRYLNRAGATAIAMSRLSGHSDTPVRIGMWIIALGIPLIVAACIAHYGLGSNPYVIKSG